MGALPWMHHSSHGQQQLIPLVQGAADVDHGGGLFYDGGADHPTFQQPVIPSTNTWGYQPSVPIDHRFHNWTMPHFLAPFANFMVNHGNHGYYDGRIDHCTQTLQDVSNAQHGPHVEQNSAEAEDLMSIDESVASKEETSSPSDNANEGTSFVSFWSMA